MSAPYISQLAARYFAGGIEAIAGNHYGGNRRNMSVEEEEKILKFRKIERKSNLTFCSLILLRSEINRQPVLTKSG